MVQASAEWLHDIIESSRCSACHKPPSANAKLKTCSRCHAVYYHDRACQTAGWKQHKLKCRKYAEALSPLVPLMSASRSNHDDDVVLLRRLAWTMRNHAQEMDTRWRRGCRLWNDQQQYLEAMSIFQSAMRPVRDVGFSSSDCPDAIPHDDNDATHQHRFWSTAILVARRLLFVAYCEMDGQQIRDGRSALCLCLRILLACPKYHDSNGDRSTLIDDAFLELTMSYEEDDDPHLSMIGARQVAQLAVQSNNACGWTTPYQRPGYMAQMVSNNSPAREGSRTDSNATCFIEREHHPQWCRTLEKHWKIILEDYQSLRQSASDWSTVGSGGRGSGETDHRVVDTGDWKEYVLFGTSETDDPRVRRTKQLIQRHCPDAIDLARRGGGEIIFSRLDPNTHIQAHCGTTNLRWTAHMGLVVPPGVCRIRVQDRWYGWDVGKWIVFDDSYEHEVRNDDPTHSRAVLLLRFWHPTVAQRTWHLEMAQQKKKENIDKRYKAPS